MKIIMNKKGFTLIEVIVSVAIMGIIAVVFLNAFGLGLKEVFFAGYKSKAEFKAQSAIENIIAGTTPVSEPGLSVNTTSSYNQIINFSSGYTITQTMDEVSITYLINGRSASISTLVP